MKEKWKMKKNENEKKRPLTPIRNCGCYGIWWEPSQREVCSWHLEQTATHMKHSCESGRAMIGQETSRTGRAKRVWRLKAVDIRSRYRPPVRQCWFEESCLRGTGTSNRTLAGHCSSTWHLPTWRCRNHTTFVNNSSLAFAVGEARRGHGGSMYRNLRNCGSEWGVPFRFFRFFFFFFHFFHFSIFQTFSFFFSKKTCSFSHFSGFLFFFFIYIYMLVFFHFSFFNFLFFHFSSFFYMFSFFFTFSFLPHFFHLTPSPRGLPGLP